MHTPFYFLLHEADAATAAAIFKEMNNSTNSTNSTNSSACRTMKECFKDPKSRIVLIIVWSLAGMSFIGAVVLLVKFWLTHRRKSRSQNQEAVPEGLGIRMDEVNGQNVQGSGAGQNAPESDSKCCF
ncbi:hypothetical protein ONS95_013843 [Cadophora gregata]|uniref:uncharacterized protein n=1 Tax=Cadophora gregata TaxID=51156 RepID=UPI0026DB4CB3|nr:uncharacterized protein ONS95_013843 [Cadophora gregata]KAK0113597.1 hypothetical protein ONS96_014452 [Cadophora gregata f. sp. sojae]KAK0114351.1 hypothetical protein ONS95_013843 [Cadophora gregata]